MTKKKYKKFLKFINKEYIGHICLQGSNHPLYFSGYLKNYFKKNNINYEYHSNSRMSLSVYFFFYKDIEIRISDHNLAANDINFKNVKTTDHLLEKIYNKLVYIPEQIADQVTEN